MHSSNTTAATTEYQKTSIGQLYFILFIATQNYNISEPFILDS